MWEYMVVKLFVTSGEEALQEKLNQYGSDGWELIAVVNNYHYFKRPKV